MVLFGVLLSGWFDLTTATPFHDEWMYRWTLDHLVRTGHLQLWPQLQPLSLVQLATALPLAAARADPRLLRLTTIPLFLLGLVAIERTARRLGANAFWAAVAAACIGCSPLVLQVQTGFLSDGTYVGLLALALWAGVRWLQDGHGLGLFTALSLGAAAQRQVGLLLIGALLIISIRGGVGSRKGLRQIATALAVGSVCTFFLQQALGVNAGKLGVVASRMLSRPVLVTALGIVLAGVPLVGLVSFPMLGGWSSVDVPKLEPVGAAGYASDSAFSRSSVPLVSPSNRIPTCFRATPWARGVSVPSNG